MSKTEKSKFVFKKHDNIGAADAEEDARFLESCFIDTGDLTTLRDCSNPKRLVVGRTGSGKSALLMRLAEVEQRVIQVRPESLALAYISNSTILQFLSELGVKLDIFFKLLWRHVFTVEILKRHFKIDSEESKQSFLDGLFNMFRDKKHVKATEYLRKWGESFWEETEYRIKEITQTLEQNLKTAVEADFSPAALSIEGAQSLTESQKKDVIQRAQFVVNQVQIRELSEILDLLKDVLDDAQKRYFIVIDRLDDDWIEDRLRFRLIRALIETIKDFSRVRNVKIVAAMRVDLLDRVFRLTRDAGFQEEKYETLYLPIEWNKGQITRVLDARIQALIRERYTKRPVFHPDILPSSVDEKNALDYMLERTMMRPRDLILFFNECLEKAEGRAQLTQQMIREAEAQYSHKRLRSLADEWVGDYPNLIFFSGLLRKRNRQFLLNSITREEIGEFCLNFACSNFSGTDALSEAGDLFIDNQGRDDFLAVVFQVFHRIGIVGLKVRSYEPVMWVGAKRRTISRSEIDHETRISIHPAYWRALGNQR